MDIIISNHTPKNLEEIYENHFLYQNENFSIMCEATEIPWLQLIPRREISSKDIALFYQTLYQLGEYLKDNGLGEQFNVAKIGNKLPYYHIHLVMRSQQDEIWPEAIWCCNNLKKDLKIIPKLKSLVERFFY